MTGTNMTDTNTTENTCTCGTAETADSLKKTTRALPPVTEEELRAAEQNARLQLAAIAVARTRLAYDEAQVLHALEYIRSGFLLGAGKANEDQAPEAQAPDGGDAE